MFSSAKPTMIWLHVISLLFFQIFVAADASNNDYGTLNFKASFGPPRSQ
jgi:hypothetical protein